MNKSFHFSRKKYSYEISYSYIFIFYIFFLTLSFISQVNAQSYTNASIAVFTLSSDLKPLTKSKVRMLFRGKLKRLQGQKIELSDWPQDNKLRDEFYQKLLGKDLAQMNAYWASLSFSGKARPPKELDDDNLEALIKWMSDKKSRIGYAPINLIPESANVLYVVKKENNNE